MCDPDGRLLWMSPVKPDGTHDLNCTRRHALPLLHLAARQGLPTQADKFSPRPPLGETSTSTPPGLRRARHRPTQNPLASPASHHPMPLAHHRADRQRVGTKHLGGPLLTTALEAWPRMRRTAPTTPTHPETITSPTSRIQRSLDAHGRGHGRQRLGARRIWWRVPSCRRAGLSPDALHLLRAANFTSTVIPAARQASSVSDGPRHASTRTSRFVLPGGRSRVTGPPVRCLVGVERFRRLRHRADDAPDAAPCRPCPIRVGGALLGAQPARAGGRPA
ncbi:hypothetical protein [Quadrisphaera sp. DSM 44207]|uniref:hypothetical protein n=1 Tax=Quadrisphaera sp. DSM 44207 TaxID=1881057 RepID=UPI003510D1FC